MLDCLPEVNKCDLKGGDIFIEYFPQVSCCEEARPCEAFLNKMLLDACPSLKPVSETQSVYFEFAKDDSLPQEGYVIKSDNEKICVFASSVKGWKYALVTLVHIMRYDDPSKPHGLLCPCCTIEDAPKYPYRAFMVDEARNFLGEDALKRIIDQMFLLKLNVLHLHFSDDQGYRLQSIAFPQITEVATTRNDTQLINAYSSKFVGSPHSGYYTFAQIRNIIEYAKERNIDVVPELDLPGHISALQSALPELSCLGDAHGVPTTFGTFADSFCLASKKAFNIIHTLLDELCSVFESQYFHIGADMFDMKDWLACPACQKLAKDQHLHDKNALFIYAVNNIVDYLSLKGKKVIVRSCDAIKDVDKRAMVQLYKPIQNSTFTQLKNSGIKFIASPHDCCSFDLPYSMSPLKKLIEFNPSKCLPDAQIIGVQGLLWGEWVYDISKAEFNSLPRLASLAQTGWSAHDITMYKFLKKWHSVRKIFDALNVNYACDSLALCNTPFKFKHNYIWKTADKYGEVRRNKK